MSRPGNDLGSLVFARQGESREEYPAYLILIDPKHDEHQANGLVLVQWADRSSKDRELVPLTSVRSLEDDSGGRRGRSRRNAAPPVPAAPAPKKKAVKKKSVAKHPPPKAKSKGKAKSEGKKGKGKEKTTRKPVGLTDLESDTEEAEFDFNFTTVPRPAKAAPKGKSKEEDSKPKAKKKSSKNAEASSKGKPKTKTKNDNQKQPATEEVIGMDADEEPTNPKLAKKDKKKRGTSSKGDKPAKSKGTNGGVSGAAGDTASVASKKSKKKKEKTAKKTGETAAASDDNDASPPSGPWTCATCTFDNEMNTGPNAECEMCQAPRPIPKTQAGAKPKAKAASQNAKQLNSTKPAGPKTALKTNTTTATSKPPIKKSKITAKKLKPNLKQAILAVSLANSGSAVNLQSLLQPVKKQKSIDKTQPAKEIASSQPAGQTATASTATKDPKSKGNPAAQKTDLKSSSNPQPPNEDSTAKSSNNKPLETTAEKAALPLQPRAAPTSGAEPGKKTSSPPTAVTNGSGGVKPLAGLAAKQGSKSASSSTLVSGTQSQSNAPALSATREAHKSQTPQGTHAAGAKARKEPVLEPAMTLKATIKAAPVAAQNGASGSKHSSGPGAVLGTNALAAKGTKPVSQLQASSETSKWPATKAASTQPQASDKAAPLPSTKASSPGTKAASPQLVLTSKNVKPSNKVGPPSNKAAPLPGGQHPVVASQKVPSSGTQTAPSQVTKAALHPQPQKERLALAQSNKAVPEPQIAPLSGSTQSSTGQLLESQKKFQPHISTGGKALHPPVQTASADKQPAAKPYVESSSSLLTTTFLAQPASKTQPAVTKKLNSTNAATTKVQPSKLQAGGTEKPVREALKPFALELSANRTNKHPSKRQSDPDALKPPQPRKASTQSAPKEASSVPASKAQPKPSVTGLNGSQTWKPSLASKGSTLSSQSSIAIIEASSKAMPQQSNVRQTVAAVAIPRQVAAASSQTSLSGPATKLSKPTAHSAPPKLAQSGTDKSAQALYAAAAATSKQPARAAPSDASSRGTATFQKPKPPQSKSDAPAIAKRPSDAKTSGPANPETQTTSKTAGANRPVKEEAQRPPSNALARKPVGAVLRNVVIALSSDDSNSSSEDEDDNDGLQGGHRVPSLANEKAAAAHKMLASKVQVESSAKGKGKEVAKGEGDGALSKNAVTERAKTQVVGSLSGKNTVAPANQSKAAVTQEDNHQKSQSKNKGSDKVSSTAVGQQSKASMAVATQSKTAASGANNHQKPPSKKLSSTTVGQQSKAAIAVETHSQSKTAASLANNHQKAPIDGKARPVPQQSKRSPDGVGQSKPSANQQSAQIKDKGGDGASSVASQQSKMNKGHSKDTNSLSKVGQPKLSDKQQKQKLPDKDTGGDAYSTAQSKISMGPGDYGKGIQPSKQIDKQMAQNKNTRGDEATASLQPQGSQPKAPNKDKGQDEGAKTSQPSQPVEKAQAPEHVQPKDSIGVHSCKQSHQQEAKPGHQQPKAPSKDNTGVEATAGSQPKLGSKAKPSEIGKPKDDSSKQGHQQQKAPSKDKAGVEAAAGSQPKFGSKAKPSEIGKPKDDSSKQGHQQHKAPSEDNGGEMAAAGRQPKLGSTAKPSEIGKPKDDSSKQGHQQQQKAPSKDKGGEMAATGRQSQPGSMGKASEVAKPKEGKDVRIPSASGTSLPAKPHSFGKEKAVDKASGSSKERPAKPAKKPLNMVMVDIDISDLLSSDDESSDEATSRPTHVKTKVEPTEENAKESAKAQAPPPPQPKASSSKPLKKRLRPDDLSCEKASGSPPKKAREGDPSATSKPSTSFDTTNSKATGKQQSNALEPAGRSGDSAGSAKIGASQTGSTASKKRPRQEAEGVVDTKGGSTTATSPSKAKAKESGVNLEGSQNLRAVDIAGTKDNGPQDASAGASSSTESTVTEETPGPAAAVSSCKSIATVGGSVGGGLVVASIETPSPQNTNHLDLSGSTEETRRISRAALDLFNAEKPPSPPKRRRQLEETKSEGQQDRVFAYAKQFFLESSKHDTTALQIIDRIQHKLGVSFDLTKKKRIIRFVKNLAEEWGKNGGDKTE